MTLQALYDLARRELEPGEALLLTEEFLGADRREILMHPEWPCPRAADFLAAVERRKSGEPLQYILGHWQFDGLDLLVQPGVLIPREDSVPLVEAAAAFIGGEGMCGLDLCAGTGAIALAVAARCPTARVEAVEWFSTPLKCLGENIARHGRDRVTSRKWNVLEKPFPCEKLDFIVANPPYIATREIPQLQAEVQLEPYTALDGGVDGLMFYRAILRNWSRCLKPGGLLAVEIGDTQGQETEALFREAGFADIEILKDINGHDRVVQGIR